MPIDLDKIPDGAWVKRAGESVLIGAVLRDSILFSWIFALLWSFTMFVTPIGLLLGEWMMVLFGLPFLLVGIYLWKQALMSAFGHVEICLGYDEGTVFSGIKGLGRTRTFVYKETDVIKEYIFVRDNGVPKYAIRIEGPSTIKFGGYMARNRREFIIKMLRTFMTEEGDKVRNSLPPDLIKHLIS